MQTYQIEVDPAALVHDGVQYEPVAFRSPKNGEKFVGFDGTLQTASFDFTNGRYLIVRPVWQWPEWLGGAAIAMDADGGVFWYEKTPSRTDSGNFDRNGGIIERTSTLVAILPSFAPPPLKPGEIVWNPKYKRNNESE